VSLPTQNVRCGVISCVAATVLLVAGLVTMHVAHYDDHRVAAEHAYYAAVDEWAGGAGQVGAKDSIPLRPRYTSHTGASLSGVASPTTHRALWSIDRVVLRKQEGGVRRRRRSDIPKRLNLSSKGQHESNLSTPARCTFPY
jgi:hypothetical protein